MNNKEIIAKWNLDSGTGNFDGHQWISGKSKKFTSSSPVDGDVLGTVHAVDKNEYDETIANAHSAFKEWRKWPAPLRGEVVRQIGDALRQNKEGLGYLVSYEMGKSLTEGLGEVQEMIDICDFSVGLSRQLYGLSMHSERPLHRMYEQWHPLGVVGIISAFNFPVAVWSWNAMIALVCGNSTVWKPSEKTPLTAVATLRIIEKVLQNNHVPPGLVTLVQGDKEVGQWMSADKKIPLVSATGSTRMGKAIAVTVAERLGKTILELGGNNAIIVTPDADLDITIPSVVFGAVGTCGQRCTTTRRLIVHESIYDKVKQALVTVYGQLRIGSPLDAENHVGPLIDKESVSIFSKVLDTIKKKGGTILTGGEILSGSGFESGCYVRPVIAELNHDDTIVHEETFAPILYIMPYQDLEEAIQIQNEVSQGLSSAMFSDRITETEQFLAAWGSDCGIANINIGTSGAEIGGAFGGEKETGGGRESGSDAWKAYMRRQTCTVNYGKDLILAQGIKFDL